MKVGIEIASGGAMDTENIARHTASKTAEQKIYQIALTLIPGVGDIHAKQLVSYCGGVKEIFHTPLERLKKIPGIGPKTAKAIVAQRVLANAEREYAYTVANNIQVLFYLDQAFPHRLKHCNDAPILLYYKGSQDLNHNKILSIVGTRQASSYGKQICEQLIEGFASTGLVVVSGLAYGIDIHAHRMALKNNLPTVGVLAHGLDRVYPVQHSGTAIKMIQQGGLLTEFPSRTNPDRENFPKRNRIVAGIADATLVVETGEHGGAMITAQIAHSYNRDVFAVPGRVGDKLSAGCLNLIKRNVAAAICSVDDIYYNMGWEKKDCTHKANKQTASVQKQLAIDLEVEENAVFQWLRQKLEAPIDEITCGCGLSTSKVASALLNLEFFGLVRSLPGKQYMVT